MSDSKILFTPQSPDALECQVQVGNLTTTFTIPRKTLLAMLAALDALRDYETEKGEK